MHVKPTSKRQTGRLRLGALLAPAPDTTTGELGPVEPVHHIGTEGNQTEATVDATTIFPPGGGNDLVLRDRPLGSHEDRRFVKFIHQPHRRKQHPATQAEVLCRLKVDIRELDIDLLAVLNLDLGVKEEPIIEAITGVKNRPQEI